MIKINPAIVEKIYDLYILTKLHQMKVSKNTVDKKNGIVYYDGGCDSKSAIILLHGFADSKNGHLMVAKELLSNYRVLIPDLPGFGENPKDHHEQYTLSFMSDKVIELIHDNDFNQVHILGHSLGGAVAMDIAVKAPGLVKSLILVGSAGFYHTDVRTVQNEILEGDNVFCVNSDHEFIELIQRVYSNPPKIPGFIFSYLSKKFQAKGEWYQKVLDDLIGELSDNDTNSKLLAESFNDKVKGFSMNTLLLWGDDDRIIPMEIGEFANSIMPKSTLKIVKNAGHAPQLENLTDYMDSLIAFLNENESGGFCEGMK